VQDDLEEINRKMLDVLDDMQRLFARKMKEASKGVLDPLLQGMLHDMGIDLSWLRGMTSGQTAVDPYRIMGLDRSASDDEVKKRYLELVHVLHPDKSGTPGTEIFFQMVTAAYEQIKKEKGSQ
jgi:hypothetical protein